MIVVSCSVVLVGCLFGCADKPQFRTAVYSCELCSERAPIAVGAPIVFGTGYYALCDDPPPHTDLGPNQSPCNVHQVTTRVECIGAPCTIGGPVPADWGKAYRYGMELPEGAHIVTATTPGKLTIRIHYRTARGDTGTSELGPYTVYTADRLDIACYSLHEHDGPRVEVTASARGIRLYGAGDSLRVEAATVACPRGMVSRGPPAFECPSGPTSESVITASLHGVSASRRIRWDLRQRTCEVLESP